MIKKSLLFFIFLSLLNCGIARQRMEISDYLIYQKGKEIIGNDNLNSFIFENDLKNIPFQQFLSAKFKSNSLQEREITVTIEGGKYKLLFYDNDEFEKYIGNSNFAIKNQESESNKTGNQSKFIAISVINDKNEDCLSEQSLYQNIVVSYLKKLKDEYLKQ